MSCFVTMGCTITPCLGLKLEANLEKTSMFDKMEPDRIFLLMVGLLDSCLYLCLLDCVITVLLVGDGDGCT